MVTRIDPFDKNVNGFILEPFNRLLDGTRQYHEHEAVDKSLDLSVSNYPAYSLVFRLQGLLVVGDRMEFNESTVTSHKSLNSSPSSLDQASFTENRLTEC
ncbi:hypothetical protein Tco_1391533 [Tanacetum coccineum]